MFRPTGQSACVGSNRTTLSARSSGMRSSTARTKSPLGSTTPAPCSSWTSSSTRLPTSTLLPAPVGPVAAQCWRASAWRRTMGVPRVLRQADDLAASVAGASLRGAAHLRRLHEAASRHTALVEEPGKFRGRQDHADPGSGRARARRSNAEPSQTRRGRRPLCPSSPRKAEAAGVHQAPLATALESVATDSRITSPVANLKCLAHDGAVAMARTRFTGLPAVLPLTEGANEPKRDVDRAQPASQRDRVAQPETETRPNSWSRQRGVPGTAR